MNFTILIEGFENIKTIHLVFFTNEKVPGAMNFTISVEGVMDVITIHSFFFQMYTGVEKISYDDGQNQIAIGYLNDLGDLKMVPVYF